MKGKALAFWNQGPILNCFEIDSYLETEDERFLNSAKKASKWLIENQEDDGSWKKVAYNSQKHTYYTRVASALFEYGEISDDEVAKTISFKNGWVDFIQPTYKWFF